MNHHHAAQLPPMGWNSWDCYGASVNEDEVRANAEYMSNNLLQYGWDTVVVDIQWSEPGANSSFYRKYVPLDTDEYSRLMPAVNRFPSAANGQGFKPLSDYVHSLGLKFGIHIMRGIPRQAAHADTAILGTTATAREIAHPNSICPWNTDMYGVDVNVEGAQAYYDSLFQLYASWGVDYIKVDDIAASRIYGIHLDEIRMIRQAIDKCGRPMVLSLSPGPAPVEHAQELVENANMWRITDDFWDIWHLLLDMFDRCERWAPHVGPGHWPDCDMLPLGHIGIRSVDGGAEDRMTRFTRDEQRTMMTLWSIFRSPLMFGGELRDNDDWTNSLLTNEEVIRVLRDGSSPRLISRENNRVVWASDNADGSLNVALFNVGEEPATVTADWSALGFSQPGSVRDLWERSDIGSPAQLAFELAPHASVLLKLTK